MAGLLAVKSFGGPDNAEMVFVGSGHKNIYEFSLNTETGALRPTGKIGEIESASFLAVSPDGAHSVYAISEGKTEADSFVSAFHIDSRTKKGKLLNRQLTGGVGPCHIVIDPSGKDVLVANYISGNVSVFPINKDGSLGAMSAFVQDQGSSVNRQRQEGPHAHCVMTEPGDRFAVACDLGIDKVMIFKFDPAKGTLEGNDFPSASIKPGSGPRHIAFHPSGRFAYVINELSSTLTAFTCDPDNGVMNEIDDYPLLPADFKRQNNAAEVEVDPSGHFVYASNRGEDTIVVFACDATTGRLSFVQRQSTLGKTPRNFDIDPSGRFLLVGNQDTGTVVVFRIDPETGRLQPTGGTADVREPMCVKCVDLTRSLTSR